MIPSTVHTWGGWLGIAGALGFLALVVALHLVQPDYDARRQPLSELALGAWGGAMLPAFACLALSLFGVQQGLRGQGASAVPRVLLLVAAIAMLAAGVLPLDRTIVNVGVCLLVVTMYLLPARGGRLRSPGLQAESWLLAVAAVAGGGSVVFGMPLGVAQRLAVGCVLLWLCLLGRRLVSHENGP